MKKLLLTILWIALLSLVTYAQEPHSETWYIDNVDSISGNETTVLGGPQVIETEKGQAVEFDGVDDGLIVDAIPLAGAEEFTVEVIFKPYQAPIPANTEQRFIHIQESDAKRMLIELRLTEDNQWFLDTFIKDGQSSKTLYAEDFLHPIGEWYHAALVYKDGIMRHYVNGQEELSGEVQFSKMLSGQTSIGVRLNQKYWFKGSIYSLRVTHQALEPKDFFLSLTDVNNRNMGSNYIPVLIDLYQNYPNPFNPNTIIRFDLSRPAFVTLTIFDELGRKIETLASKTYATGSHKIYWQAVDKNLSGGLYYARLRAETETKSLKLLFLP